MYSLEYIFPIFGLEIMLLQVLLGGLSHWHMFNLYSIALYKGHDINEIEQNQLQTR